MPKTEITIDGIVYTIDQKHQTAYVSGTIEGELPNVVAIVPYVSEGNRQYPVTGIENSAFYGCHGLTSITIPDSVTSIGEGAFRNCSVLTSITIPNSVTSMGEGAFDGYTNLSIIRVPKEKKEAYCQMGLEPWRKMIQEEE